MNELILQSIRHVEFKLSSFHWQSEIDRTMWYKIFNHDVDYQKKTSKSSCSITMIITKYCCLFNNVVSLVKVLVSYYKIFFTSTGIFHSVHMKDLNLQITIHSCSRLTNIFVLHFPAIESIVPSRIWCFVIFKWPAHLPWKKPANTNCCHGKHVKKTSNCFKILFHQTMPKGDVPILVHNMVCMVCAQNF